jgi:hypothetical protein
MLTMILPASTCRLARPITTMATAMAIATLKDFEQLRFAVLLILWPPAEGVGQLPADGAILDVIEAA